MEKNTQTRPIPAHPTNEEYLAEKKMIRDTYCAMLVFMVILLVPLILAALLLWTADFFSSPITCMIALLIIGIPSLILLTTVMQTLQEEQKRLRQLTRNYQDTAGMEEYDS